MKLRYVLTLFFLVVPALASAQTGIIWPPGNFPVEGGSASVVVAGKPGEMWTIFVDGRPLRTAPLDESGRRRFHFELPESGDVEVGAKPEDGNTSYVRLSRGNSPEVAPPPTPGLPPAESLEVYWPEPGQLGSTRTTMVVGGRPGEKGAIRFRDELLAEVTFDTAGIAEVDLATAWWVPGQLSVESEGRRAMVYVVPAEEVSTPMRIGPLPRGDTGRRGRLLANMALFAVSGLVGLEVSTEGTPDIDETGVLIEERAEKVTLVMAGVMPFAYFLPYLYGEYTPSFAVPVLLTLAASLGGWGVAKAIAEVGGDRAELAYLASPLVTFLASIVVYEKAAELAEWEEFEVAPGPGDAGLSIQRSW